MPKKFLLADEKLVNFLRGTYGVSNLGKLTFRRSMGRRFMAEDLSWV